MRQLLAVAAVASLATASCATDDRLATERAERTGQVASALNASPHIGDFVVYAGRSVKLGTAVHSLGGDIGVATTAPSTFGLQLTVGSFDGLDVFHNLIAPSISLGSLSVVGDVQTNNLQNGGGALLRQAAFPASAMPLLPLATGATPGTTNVSVAPLQIVTLNPGSYGTLTDNGTVLLNPGSYTFANVVLGNLAQLEANPGGSTTIAVAGTFAAGQGVHVWPLLQTADKLTINVAGSDAAGGTPSAVSFGSGSAVVSLLGAPHGTVTLGDSTLFTGAVAAFDVIAGDGVSFTFQSGLTSAGSYPQGQQSIDGQLWAPIAAGAVPLVGPLPGAATLTLAVGLPLTHHADLQAFIPQLSDPRSSHYRKYMQPADFAAAYGPQQSEYDALTTFVHSNGLTVAQSFSSRSLMLVSGTAAAIQNAFFVNLNVYQRPDGTTFYAPANQPSANLSATILHITGLDNFAVPHAGIGGGGTGPQLCTPNLNATAQSFVGTDFRSIYLPCSNLNLDGTNQTIGLFEPGTYYANDVADYLAQFLPGVSASQVGTVTVGSTAPSLPALSGNCNALAGQLSGLSPAISPPVSGAGTNCQATTLPGSVPNDQIASAGAEGEVALDIVMALSMAPKAKVLVYQEDQGSPAQSMIVGNYNPDAILAKMADDDVAKTLSSSWQWLDAVQDTNLPQIFEQFAAQGQSYFQDSGDLGAYIPGNPALTNIIDPIIDSSLMTVVGGTQLTTTGSGSSLTYRSETTWNDPADRSTTNPANPLGNSATGGGICSGYTSISGGGSTVSTTRATLPIPGYQLNINPSNTELSTTARMIPDVAAVADGISLYSDFAFPLSGSPVTLYDPVLGCSGGTSAATPLWAGLTALANQAAASLGLGPIGFANPTLYRLAASGASANSINASFFHDVNDMSSNFFPGSTPFSGDANPFHATSGYDLTTGLGSPVGCGLVPAEPPQSCMPGTSLSALIQGTNVTAYIPNGSWSETGTGVSAVPVEGSGPSGKIATSAAINTCSGNSSTGTVVCVDNETGVYIINGTTVTTTLTSGATTNEAAFSGGRCKTCNVAVDPLHNRALLSIGLAGGAAFQSLDLGSNMLDSPISTGQSATSEDIAVDGSRNYVLSPNEAGDYQILDITSGKVFDFNPPGGPTGPAFDQAAEDCTTGIAVASVEYTNQLLLVDLSQATFSGTTWSAPSAFQTIPELSAGSTTSPTTGPIAIAPSSHLGVVASEFGGNQIGAIVLPLTSGAGSPTPALSDWVVANMPSDPDGNTWVSGLDPHTLTAYTSPTNGRQYGIVENDFSGSRTWLAIIDLQALLNPSVTPRVSGSGTTHAAQSTPSSCNPGTAAPNPSGCVIRFAKIPQ